MLQHDDAPETTVIAGPQVDAGQTAGLLLDESFSSAKLYTLAELAADLRASVEGSKRRIQGFVKVTQALGCVSVGVILFGTYLVLEAHPTTPSPSEKVLPLVVGCVGVIAAFLVGAIPLLRRARCTERERTAAERLMHINDPGAVPLLLDNLAEIYTVPLRPALWQALVRLLPRMQEEEIRQISPEQYGMLAHWVSCWDNPLSKMSTDVGSSFLLALLPVLGRYGQGKIQARSLSDPKTMDIRPILRKWAQGKGSGQDREVQQAAAACLEAIQQQMTLAQTEEQLLRASTATPTVSESLLRPAVGEQQTNPRELLRPEGSEEGKIPQ